MRTYLFRDYTEALTKAHGVREAYPDFSLEMIQSMPEKHRPGIFAAYLNIFTLLKPAFRAERRFFMYGVSKINIEPSLMMISVQDVEFKGNSLARYLQILQITALSWI